MAGEAITFVITSCGRFDLLEETLASFFACNTAPIERYVLVEDSGDPGVHEVLARFAAPFDVMINDPPRGQIAAIDRAYRTVTTPYIFHCEDDWRFFRSGFIEDSLAILKHDPLVTTIQLRRPGQNTPVDWVSLQRPLIWAGNVGYRKPRVWDMEQWQGYNFNPGLRRLSDYRQLGSFSRWGHEIDASMYFKLRGRTVGFLAKAACETTGTERRLPKQQPVLSLRSRWQTVHARWRYKLTHHVARWTRIARRSRPEKSA